MAGGVQANRTIFDLVNTWTAAAGATQRFSAARDLISLLDDELYHQYEPIAEKAPFLERLALWLQNCEGTTEQQVLFDLVPWLLFIGKREMESLFRSAVNGPIARWIVDQAALDISDPALATSIADELRHTLFCSVAGMDVGAFLRVNSLQGQDLRPNLRELTRIGDLTEFTRQTSNYRRIVAVEDIVGTGAQLEQAVSFVRRLPNRNILICPLVIAPAGIDTWKQIENDGLSHCRLEPVFVISSTATLPESLPSSHPEELRAAHQLALETWSAVKGATPSQDLYGAFGCGSFGSLVLTYHNCPDNVPPLIHHTSEQWHALFPRISR